MVSPPAPEHPSPVAALPRGFSSEYPSVVVTFLWYLEFGDAYYRGRLEGVYFSCAFFRWNSCVLVRTCRFDGLWLKYIYIYIIRQQIEGEGLVEVNWSCGES